ncbi:hypothetical protein LJ739_06755 [Aestuariibacter halophilus]|uniref:Uncharacterized protein n=1 Tax=Fluctibacter halophilus TaxID=226011 RepID=A0ABS8G792_9ALTE|nr:hypothetical protein [Aestuariibacter halophilus]MCC2615936.1 hypothetical protein [Aestuariibacter halophilus]
MRVKAKQTGFYGGRIIQEGKVFSLEGATKKDVEAAFSSKWMEKVSASETKPTAKGATKSTANDGDEGGDK